MTNIPKFNATQREFIHAGLAAAAPVGKIVEDLIEIYAQFRTAGSDIKSTLSDRITKIKARLPEIEQQVEWETVPHYLSAAWRLAYFRALLGETADVSLKIRLLGEIRKEVNTLDQKNKEDEPHRKAAYEKQRSKEIPLYTYDPQYLADEDARLMAAMKHGSTPLSIKSYEKLAADRYRRKSDGVVVDKEGVPESIGEKTHIEWITEQKQIGLYICDQKIEAEVLPSPLVVDKAHREAYKNACEKGWIFEGSCLPQNAYQKITKYEYGNDHYRRMSDGVVVDKLGIPFTQGEKDHHTWLCEQEGLYNYAPEVDDGRSAIKTV